MSKYSFVHDKAEFRVEIHPTLIEEKKNDGSLVTLAYYPTASDEVVEDALIKIAGERGAGFYSDDHKIAGVCFSLYRLRKELSKAKSTKSYDQIIKSLKILAGSIIVVEGEWRGKRIKIKSPFFPQFSSVSRADLLEDPAARCSVQFHPLVYESLVSVNYRQFNYDRLMKHSRQLARWLHKLLIQKFVFATIAKPYEIQFLRIKRDSRMLDGYTKPADALTAVNEVLNELKKNDVLLSYTSSPQFGQRRRIIDVTYHLFPSVNFVMEIRAANLRLKQLREKEEKRKLLYAPRIDRGVSGVLSRSDKEF